MPNITMCTTQECPFSTECYRYMAVPTPRRQSYAAFEPVAKMSGTHCRHYVEISDGDVIRTGTPHTATKALRDISVAQDYGSAVCEAVCGSGEGLKRDG